MVGRFVEEMRTDEGGWVNSEARAWCDARLGGTLGMKMVVDCGGVGCARAAGGV